ncbi:MAG: hypothetical protein HOW97_03320 [Catenulispora sp.]|nr:hypothetical protein [Catenulispora sp.]NUR57262.1 hypothetical protein [Catenulispora sp.]
MTPFRQALTTTSRSAFHLEQRDAYALGEGQRASYEAFLAGNAPDIDPDGPFWGSWVRTVREARARGVEFRRLRIVSEPLSDYLRWERAITVVNIAAGEQVRWLPRRACTDLAVVPVDFWVLDSSSVLFGYFSGDGASTGHELRSEPEIAKIAADSFEAAWARAIPHDSYVPA